MPSIEGSEPEPGMARSALLPSVPPAPSDALPVRAGRVAVGAVSRAGTWLDIASGGSGRLRSPVAVDVVIGAAEVTLAAAVGVARAGWWVTGPARAVVARPPLVPEAYQPASVVAALAARGRRYVQASELETDAAVATLVPRVVAAVLDRLDLTEVVLRRVDLDRVVAAVDIEAVIDRLDLTAIVADHVDLDAIVAKVDIEAVIDRLDLTAIVADHVDLDSIVAKVDMDAIINRIDLVGLANYVIDEIDLPEIIRESTGSVASETVRGVRMQSIEADQAVQRRINRLLRRRDRSPGGPGAVDGTGPAEVEQ